MTWVRGFCRAVALAAGAFGSSTFWNRSDGSDTLSIVAGAVDPEQRRRRAGALSAHHRDVGVSRPRMDDEIGHGDFPRAGAEQRGELFIQRVEALGAGCAAAGLRAEVEREDRGALGVGGEQRAVRSERERSDGRQRGPWPVCATCSAEDGTGGQHDEGDEKPEFDAEKLHRRPFQKPDNATPAGRPRQADRYRQTVIVRFSAASQDFVETAPDLIESDNDFAEVRTARQMLVRSACLCREAKDACR